MDFVFYFVSPILQHLRCLYSTSIDKDSEANNLGYHCMMWNDQPTAVMSAYYTVNVKIHFTHIV